MYMRRASQPINIEPSSPVDHYSKRGPTRNGHATNNSIDGQIPIHARDSDEESDADSDYMNNMNINNATRTHHHRHMHSNHSPPLDGDGNMNMESSLSASYNNRKYGHHLNGHSSNNINMNIHRTFDNMNLTVGSLPSSRRERRFMVSHGNNERHAFHGAPNASGSKTGLTSTSSFSNRAAAMLLTSSGRNTYNDVNGHGHGHGRYEEDLSKSMPGMLRAPFLHSRKDRATDTKLSRIPSMRLPESVTDGSEASSVPYGSLNESQFRMPSSSFGGGGAGSYQTKVRFADPNNGPTLDIQKRVQEMKKNGTLMKNGEGGLASLFGGGGGDNNNSSSSNGGSHGNLRGSNSNPIRNGGIGSSLTNADDGINKREGFVSPLSSLVNKLEGNHDRQTKDEQSKRVGVGGGIGSLLETSHSSAQEHVRQDEDELSMPSNINLLSTQSLSGTTITTGAMSSMGNISSALGTSLSADNIHANATANAQTTSIQQLSSSMTGLSILKTSPKGDMVHLSLSPQDRLALTNRCANTDTNNVNTNLASSGAPNSTTGNSFLQRMGRSASDSMQERRHSNESDYSHQQQHHHRHTGGIAIVGNGDDDPDEFFDMDM